MKIKRTINGGIPNRKAKWLDVSAMNIAPDTIVALSAGAGKTLLDVSLLENYDTFNVAQTSLATDIIVLPNAAPVGTVIKFIALSAIDIECEAASGIGINGGADTTDIGQVINSLMVLQKITATRWIATQYAPAGTVSAPVPA
jgi:hypothetical protein